jgi:hypothetical protein
MNRHLNRYWLMNSSSYYYSNQLFPRNQLRNDIIIRPQQTFLLFQRKWSHTEAKNNNNNSSSNNNSTENETNNNPSSSSSSSSTNPINESSTSTNNSMSSADPTMPNNIPVTSTTTTTTPPTPPSTTTTTATTHPKPRGRPKKILMNTLDPSLNQQQQPGMFNDTPSFQLQPAFFDQQQSSPPPEQPSSIALPTYPRHRKQYLPAYMRKYPLPYIPPRSEQINSAPPISSPSVSDSNTTNNNIQPTIHTPPPPQNTSLPEQQQQQSSSPSTITATTTTINKPLTTPKSNPNTMNRFNTPRPVPSPPHQLPTTTTSSPQQPLRAAGGKFGTGSKFGIRYPRSPASQYISEAAKQKTANLDENLQQWYQQNMMTASSFMNNYPPRPRLNIAILIDSENIAYKYIHGVIAEVQKLGTITIRRIYGDWTSELMRGWRPIVLTNALDPIHQFRSSFGKGNSDSALIIDAMELLFTKRNEIDAFCIVSSDADFTRLATKLRAEGKKVVGIGSFRTPAPFICSCDRFVYLHHLPAEMSKYAGWMDEGLPLTSSAPIQQQQQHQQQQPNFNNNNYPPSTGGDWLINSPIPMVPVATTTTHVGGGGKSSTSSSKQPPSSTNQSSSTVTFTQPITNNIKSSTTKSSSTTKNTSSPKSSKSSPTINSATDYTTVNQPQPITNKPISRLGIMTVTRAWAEIRGEAGWAPLPLVIKTLENRGFDPIVHGYPTIESYVNAVIDHDRLILNNNDDGHSITTSSTTEQSSPFGSSGEIGKFLTRQTVDGTTLISRRAF